MHDFFHAYTTVAPARMRPVCAAVCTAAVWLLSAAPALADIRASTSGKCPTDYTYYTRKGGDGMCRTPEKAEKPAKESKSKSTSSSSGGGEAKPWDTAMTYANRPVTASVQKTKETDLCPTGYFTNRMELSKCDTHFGNAPKTRLKGAGACTAGETLERGLYCSGTTSLTPSEMGGAATADFNELYTALSVKNGRAPELSSAEPELYAATAGQRQAAKAQAEADEKARAEAAAPKRLAAYDPNCSPYLPNIGAANNCQQMVEDMRAQQRALGLVPAGAPVGAPAPQAVPASIGQAIAGEALKQGLKGLFGK